MNRDWRDDAACLGLDPEDWFPRNDDTSAPAKKICRSCPVRDECLEYAVRMRIFAPDTGIYGGLTPKQRATLARRSA